MNTCTRLVTVLLLCATAALAATPAKSVKWLDDFTAAKAVALKEGKPILANFTGSDWCPWCIKLEKEVFSQKEFQDYASANLVLFIADFPNGKKLAANVVEQNQGLQAKYRITGYPTVLLLDAEGKVLAHTGYQEGGAAPYVESLKEMLGKSRWRPAATTNQTAKAIAPAAK